MDYFIRKSPLHIKNIKKQNKQLEKINNRINEIIKNNFYIKLSNINSKNLFYYIVILISSIIFFNYINIKFKAVIGIIIGLIIIYIIYNKNELNTTLYTNELKIKLELLKPKPLYFENYPELIEFFYSIRNFYNYNNDSFSNCVKDVDTFVKLYNDIKKGIKYSNKNIDVIRLFKKKALNNLHSLIYSIENNKIIEKKLKESLTELNKILNIYIDDMIDIINNDIKKNGYNYEKSYLFKEGPKAYNTFLSNSIYFDLY